MPKNAFYDRFFRATHGGRLIYNSCWEDPRADRALLGLGPDARIAMITSAGCNALDYLLDDPKEIHCIDVNARQNALLELKLAAIKVLSFTDFFEIFGRGGHPQFEALYQDLLRKELSSAARQYWDAHQHYFNPRSLRGSFYFYGASGDVAYFVRSFLRYLRPALHQQLLALLECKSLVEQAAAFERIEAKLFSPALQWLVRQPFLLSLLGVPRAQRDLITPLCAPNCVMFSPKPTCVRTTFGASICTEVIPPIVARTICAKKTTTDSKRGFLAFVCTI